MSTGTICPNVLNRGKTVSIICVVFLFLFHFLQGLFYLYLLGSRFALGLAFPGEREEIELAMTERGLAGVLLLGLTQQPSHPGQHIE